MATKSLHVLVPVTLCFLLVFAAQGRDHNVTVTVQGQARCQNNPSAVMSHTTLHLMINGKTVPGAGTTTSTGQIVMAVNLTTRQQLVSMMSNRSRVLVKAPPHACGAPSIPKGAVVAAPFYIEALIIRDTPAASMVIPVVNGKLQATNDGDAARLKKLLSGAGRGQPTIAALDGLVLWNIFGILGGVRCFVCDLSP